MNSSSHYPAIGLGGKVAIVSGATRGIGRATSLRLASLGAKLVLSGTNAELLKTLSKEIDDLGTSACWSTGDVADPETATKLVELASETFGPPDILVNNAGANHRCPTLAMDLQEWNRLIAVNLSGTLHLCRAVLPAMVARGAGVIVNVSSVAAKTPHSNAAPGYGVSKAGVNALTQHLALEMAPHRIRVNAVCPGPVETDMTADWTDEYRKSIFAKVPLARLGKPEEIADAIVFLASPMSGFITGETINVNGGSYMN